VLIAAHGSWEPSPLDRDAQGLPQRPHDLFAFKANFTRSQLEQGLLPVLAFPGGYGGIVVGDHAITTLAFCIRRDKLSDCRKTVAAHKAAEAAIAYVMRSCQPLRAMLANAAPQDSWLSVGPIRPGIRLGTQRSGAFLVGNAAGESHPIIGEGISMALQSAWLLAERLAPHRKRGADPDLQRAIHADYATAWRRQFASRIRMAALFAHVAMRPALMGSLLPVLQRYPQLLTQAAQWSGKVRSPGLHAEDAERLPHVNGRSA
jgi:2-polyprenyl-6-methoxyphenol hydroxylase-like FAD-dependent oxidoreductase